MEPERFQFDSSLQPGTCIPTFGLKRKLPARSNAARVSRNEMMFSRFRDGLDLWFGLGKFLSCVVQRPIEVIAPLI
jgi:hypothetical protein